MRALLLLIFLTFSAHAFDHSHQGWNKVLKSHIKSVGHQTLFNYKKLKQNPKAFNSYLKSLSDVSKAEFSSWNSSNRLSFLINAYNAFTVKLIIDHYPVSSIKDIGSFFKNAWKQKFIPLFGEKIHLDEIEHELIRKKFSEPRIHFAVVCASLGCPSLSQNAYTGDQLEKQLKMAAENFLNDKNKNNYQHGKLSLSKIFKWYGDDFNKKYGSYLNFMAPYLGKNQSEVESIKKLSPSWLNYDWKLNEWK